VFNLNNWKLKFGVIWGGSAISIFTSAIMQMALIWHLAIATESAMILSVASIAGFLPMTVLGSFAGALVDRYSRKLIMIISDLYLAAVALGLVIYTLFAEPSVWVILVVLFVRSIGTAFHTPAISAVTPLIVPETHLTKCSGYTQSLQTLGFIAGASIAAVLYPLWGISGMVALDIAGAVLASIAVIAVKIPSLPVKQQEEKQKIVAEIKESFTVFKTHKGLYALLWIGAIFTFFYAPINALFPLMSMGHFGGTTTHASIAEVTFASGMMLGGVVLGIWGGFRNRGITMFAAIALMGAAITASGLLPTTGFAAFAVFSLFMGLSAPFYTGPNVALMQEKYKPEYLGRIFGFYGSISSAAMLLGLVATGLSADAVGVNILFLASGIAISLLAVATIITPSVRHIERNK
jgi:DHA3 family macrolide efflux protein-like MFS transporter